MERDIKKTADKSKDKMEARQRRWWGRKFGDEAQAARKMRRVGAGVCGMVGQSEVLNNENQTQFLTRHNFRLHR